MHIYFNFPDINWMQLVGWIWFLTICAVVVEAIAKKRQ